MKLKDLIKLPKKTIFKKDVYGDIPETTDDFIKMGINEMIDKLGEIEIELDVRKIENIVAPISTKYHDNSIPYEGTGIDEGVRKIAEAIADNFKEIIK